MTMKEKISTTKKYILIITSNVYTKYYAQLRLNYIKRDLNNLQKMFNVKLNKLQNHVYISEKRIAISKIIKIVKCLQQLDKNYIIFLVNKPRIKLYKNIYDLMNKLKKEKMSFVDELKLTKVRKCYVLILTEKAFKQYYRQLRIYYLNKFIKEISKNFEEFVKVCENCYITKCKVSLLKAFEIYNYCRNVDENIVVLFAMKIPNKLLSLL